MKCAKVSALHVWGVLGPFFQLIAALIIVFETWGYRPITRLVAMLAHWRVWAELEARIAALPPYAALAAFLVPAAILIPVKLLAVFLFATGHWIVGGGLIVLAKIVSTALVGRIYQLTESKLMTIAWFKAAYDRIVPWCLAVAEDIRRTRIWARARLLKQTVRALILRYLPKWPVRLQPTRSRSRNPWM